MRTWPQHIAEARILSGMSSESVPTNHEWMVFYSRALQTMWAKVHDIEPRALPRNTVNIDAAIGTLRYPLPVDFGVALNVEWNASIAGNPVIIVPRDTNNPHVYVNRDIHYDTELWKYDIQRAEGNPELLDFMLYRVLQEGDDIYAIEDGIQIEYLSKPIQQHFGVAQMVDDDNLIFAVDATVPPSNATAGVIVSIDNYYKNTFVFIMSATDNAFQFQRIDTYDPETRQAYLVDTWPKGMPTGTVTYMTVPNVPFDWLKPLVSQAILDAMLQDENSMGMVEGHAQMMGAAYEELTRLIEKQFPAGPRLIADTGDYK